MTEEEAKKKACCGPVGSGVATGQCQWVESEDVEYVVMWPTRNCMGSACMAWRWHGHVDRATGRLLQGLTDIEYSESDDHVAAVGFCGLAGKP